MRNKKSGMKSGCAVTAALSICSGLAWGAEGTDPLTAAVTRGKVDFDYRLRGEWVDQDGLPEEAAAYTGRLRLGYKTRDLKGFGAYVQLEHVDAFAGEDYNSSDNGKTQYPVVADPADTELNQAYLSYGGLYDTDMKLGRQRIILDNARFVGNVGWRQNEQTFDAFSVQNKSIPKTVLTYAYLDRVQNITFDEIELSAHLLNAAYDLAPWAKLIGYGYLLDYDLDAGPTKDTQTLGLRAQGSAPVGAGKLLYTLEYAQQSDYGESDSTVDADYYLAELGGTLSGVTVKFSREVLGGDGVYNFQTPLATKHIFNGWADKFLGDLIAGGKGLQDNFVTVSGAVMGVTLTAMVHDFQSDAGDMDYGTEWDLMATRPVTPNLSLTVKYADYQADDFATDTQKIWLMGEFKF
jgi:hypothetical protein